MESPIGRVIPTPLQPWARLAVKTPQAWAAGRRYRAAKRVRSAQYAASGLSFDPDPAVFEALDRDGYAVIKGAVDPAALAEVREQLQAALDRGVLDPVLRNPAAPGPIGDKFLTDAELAKGEAYIAAHANEADIRHSLLNCPAAVPFAFYEPVIDIAAAFFGCVPAVTGAYLTKNFVNDLPDLRFNHFHADEQSPWFMKSFYYLNDVDEDGGPFTYVVGSHRAKPFNYRRQYYWSLEEIETVYGRDRIHFVTASAGDIILANVTGFHRGTKVRKRPRHFFMVNWGVHRQFYQEEVSPRLTAAQMEGFTPKQRAAADFVDIVPD